MDAFVEKSGTDDTPTACLVQPPSSAVECGSGVYLWYPHQQIVGRLWTADATFDVDEGVVDVAYDTYGDPSSPDYDPDRYNLFVNTGNNTKVNY